MQSWTRAGIVMGVVAAGSYAAIVHAGGSVFYPLPDTESRFLSAYNAELILDRYKSERYSFNSASGREAGAGYTYVKHGYDIDSHFVVKSNQIADLLRDLAADVQYRVQIRGGEIVGSGGDERRGYHVTYREGQVIGSIKIYPPVDASFPDHKPLCLGSRNVSLKVVAEEHWFPAR